MNNQQKLSTLETFAKSGVFRSSDNFTQAALAGQMIDLQRAANRDRAWIQALLQVYGPELIRQLQEHKQNLARPGYGAQDGWVYRNGQSINIAQMQADLEADNRRLEELRQELRRRVQRERSGYR